MRARALATAVAAAAAMGLAACGNSGVDDTPAACLQGPDAYRKALDTAPGAVLVDGETKISECLVEGQSAGELTQAGSAIVLVATELNQAAREDPGGTGALQLGYLVGAVQQGASDTEGIHADLIRRLDAAAGFAPAGTTLPPEFERSYEAGLAAGKEGG